MVNDVIKKVFFSDLSIKEPIFQSLVSDYPGFEDWFNSKGSEEAYIFREGSTLDGFLYLKDETEADNSINPVFKEKRRLKIGTFKINAHGTILGQRFMSIILRKMINENFSEVYVTLFNHQKGLIKLFEKFGFVLWGHKVNGELVYVKDTVSKGSMFSDYPRVVTKDNKKYMLSIYPKFHTKMFPDSKLLTERNHVIEDLSFTNTVEKIYLCAMSDTRHMKTGDLVVIYRTAEDNRKAEFNSVATSICTIIEVKSINSFIDKEDFLKYCGKGSIFTKDELDYYWKTKRYPYIIKMLYNVPLTKRITRNRLITEVGISRYNYWGFFEINDNQLQEILKIGEVNEGFIID